VELKEGQPIQWGSLLLNRIPSLFGVDMLRRLLNRGRSRMAKSSYEYLFCKPGLRWLFSDYMLPRASVNFRASEDISWKLRLGQSEMGDTSFGGFMGI
jgi:hypothetical protein